MLIGIDFDNTIVCYDQLFHQLASERGLIERDLTASKFVIRDHLRSVDREDEWTELQGLAYGPAITRAAPYPGVLEFMELAQKLGIPTRIVSHKTRHPYRGTPHDLHAAARGFLAQQHITTEAFLEPTKEAKVSRIAELGCTHFIDDLPEFLTLDMWPTSTARFLFDPGDMHPDDHRYTRVHSWQGISQQLLGERGGQ